MASSAREDYLKAIYELQEAVGIAKTNQLAAKLAIRAATVSEMIQRMSKERPRLITYRHHQGVRLTAAGKKAALGVIRRHRLLETFLHRTLGLSWDEIHEEAEVLEHHLSPRVTDAIDRHLEHPRFDPHGEPIPDRKGKLESRPQIPLTEVNVGDRFIVSRVKPATRDLLAYLQQLDIGIQSTGRLISESPLDGPLTIAIDHPTGEVRHVLGRAVAACIRVAPDSGAAAGHGL